MTYEIRIARHDDGRAYGTRAVLLAPYTDIASGRRRLRVVGVAEFRGHLHKVRARDWAHEMTTR